MAKDNPLLGLDVSADDIRLLIAAGTNSETIDWRSWGAPATTSTSVNKFSATYLDTGVDVGGVTTELFALNADGSISFETLHLNDGQLPVGPDEYVRGSPHCC